MSATTEASTGATGRPKSIVQTVLQVAKEIAPWMKAEDCRRLIEECHGDEQIAIERLLEGFSRG